jgi:trk system potassium uptake protein TrkH
MHALIILKILGLLLMLFSMLGNIPPILVSLFYDDGMIMPFLQSMSIIFGSGLTMWLLSLRSKAELNTRDGFLIVTLFFCPRHRRQLAFHIFTCGKSVLHGFNI